MSFLEDLELVLPKGLSLAQLKKAGSPQAWEDNPQLAAISAPANGNHFDSADYLNRYPDVANAGVDPIWHFISSGMYENRHFNLPGQRGVPSPRVRINKKSEFRPEREDSISVMIPAWNAETYLERAIRSIQAQSHKNLEIIVYDDASTDRTREIALHLASEDPRIRVVQGESQQGQGVGRNISVKYARGNYCSYLDADDYYFNPEFLAALLTESRSSGADVVISPYRRQRGGKQWTDKCPGGVYSGIKAAQLLLDREFGSHGAAAKLYRTKIAAATAFNEFGYSEDVPAVAQILAKARSVAVCQTSGYLYDQDPVSSWRPTEPGPLHFYSSLRVLPEITLLCWHLGLDIGPFAKIWQAEHGKRIASYLAKPANLAGALEIFSWFDWFTPFFDQLLPDLRHYFIKTGHSGILSAKYRQYVGQLLAGLERQIQSSKATSLEKPGLAIWIQHLANGGLERVAAQFGNVLADKYDVAYIMEEPDKRSYPVRGRVIKADLFDLQIHAILNSARHIVDMHWKNPAKAYPFCDLAIRKYAHKYVPTIHNTDSAWAYYDVTKKNLDTNLSDGAVFPAIICVSEAVRQAFVSSYGDCGNLKTLHNPVDLKACQSAVAIQKPFPYILFAGRLNATEHKGLDLLLQAWAMAQARKRGLKLFLAGSGRLEPRIEACLHEHNLADSIEITGFTDRIYSYMKGALFTVLPSRREGFSMTLIESLACGTPVLATKVGGAAEIILPGENGELINPGDPNLLAAGIDKMVQKAESMKGFACMESVRQLDISEYGKRIEAALEY